MTELSLTIASPSSLSTSRCIPSDPVDLYISSFLNSSESSTLDNAYTPEPATRLMDQGGPSAELTCEDRSNGRIEFLSLFSCHMSLGSLLPQAAGLHLPWPSFGHPHKSIFTLLIRFNSEAGLRNPRPAHSGPLQGQPKPASTFSALSFCL